MKHPAKIENGQLLMKDREAFKSEISNKRNGNYFVELKRETRSNPQNRYYWGVVIDVLSKELGYEPEEMHDILKYKFNKGDVRVKDESFSLGLSTTKLDTQGFAMYLDNIIRWASIDLGIYIPDANEYELNQN